MWCTVLTASALLASVLSEGPAVSGGLARSNAYYGAGNGDILLDDMACMGSEATLNECNHRQPIGSHNCGHSEDVGVECGMRCSCAAGSILQLDPCYPKSCQTLGCLAFQLVCPICISKSPCRAVARVESSI